MLSLDIDSSATEDTVDGIVFRLRDIRRSIDPGSIQDRAERADAMAYWQSLNATVERENDNDEPTLESTFGSFLNQGLPELPRNVFEQTVVDTVKEYGAFFSPVSLEERIKITGDMTDSEIIKESIR